mgnify:CR=1 FL=1
MNKMDVTIVFCKTCGRETVHDVTHYSQETEDGWFEITIMCSECGKEHTIKVYSS